MNLKKTLAGDLFKPYTSYPLLFSFSLLLRISAGFFFLLGRLKIYDQVAYLITLAYFSINFLYRNLS